MFVKRLLGFGVALAVFSACGDSPLESDPLDTRLFTAADRTVKMVPWKGIGIPSVLDPDETAALDCGTAPIKGWSHESGKARHLGQYTGSSSACIVFTGPPVDGVLTLLTTASDLVYIAANGDEVWMAMDPSNPVVWLISPWPGDAATQTTTLSGGYNIIGGTGRFAGATGYVTGIDPGDGSWTTEGTISSPGSIKWSGR